MSERKQQRASERAREGEPSHFHAPLLGPNKMAPSRFQMRLRNSRQPSAPSSSSLGSVRGPKSRGFGSALDGNKNKSSSSGDGGPGFARRAARLGAPPPSSASKPRRQRCGRSGGEKRRRGAVVAAGEISHGEIFDSISNGRRKVGRNRVLDNIGAKSRSMAAVELAASSRLAPMGAGRRWNDATTKAVIRKHMDDLLQEEESCDSMEKLRSNSRMFQIKWSQDGWADCLVSEDGSSVRFHPTGSYGTRACLASEPLKRNGNYYYWEIRVLDQAYGTSVMFGLCTRGQQRIANDFCNLIGLDEQGWSMSHKGLIWHAGTSRPYSSPFPANRPVTIGLLYDSMSGRLSYFMDGRSLGVAFFGLNEIQEDLYPCVGSTAKNTVMVLLGAYYGHESLVERTCFSILRHSQDHAQLFKHLKNNYRLPAHLLDYLKQCSYSRENGNKSNQTDTASSPASRNHRQGHQHTLEAPPEPSPHEQV